MDAVKARESIIDALRREVVGPDPMGDELLIESGIRIDDVAKANTPFRVAGSKEEILRDKPTLRYGAAVIFPDGELELGAGLVEDSSESEDAVDADEQIADDGDDDFKGQIREYADDDPLDMEVDSTAKLKQSSLGLSFFAKLLPGDMVRITVSGGRYEPYDAAVAGKKGMSTRKWWVRRSVSESFDLPVKHEGGRVVGGISHGDLSTGPISIRATLRVRPPAPTWPATADGYICTASIMNVSKGGVEDAISLFQTEVNVEVIRDGQVQDLICPYPEREESTILSNDPEARSIALLYRNNPTFAIGHGCSATWQSSLDGNEPRIRSFVKGEFLPVVEVPSMTPIISDSNGVLLSVPMGPLAGLDDQDDGMASLERMVVAYETWIAERHTEAAGLVGMIRIAADDHLVKCAAALVRMREGIKLLKSNADINRAFQLENLAVLSQQLYTPQSVRKAELDKDGIYRTEALPPAADWRTVEGRGSWRSFQIGFLLSNLSSTVFEDDPMRENVELIFFPTGGGKTEAYQGLLAFNLFYQRIIGSTQKTSAIMRYTLRLLTAQQFQRALGLISWMEMIRDEKGIGGERFTLGIWVGSSLTPQTREDALQSLAQLKNAKRDNVENKFLLLKCPMCSAQMGLIKSLVKRKPLQLMGYQQSGSVDFVCPDSNCYYNRNNIPAYVIDEDIYDVCCSVTI